MKLFFSSIAGRALLVGVFALGWFDMALAKDCPVPPDSCYAAISSSKERWLSHPFLDKSLKKPLPNHCTGLGNSYANSHELRFSAVTRSADIWDLIRHNDPATPYPSSPETSTVTVKTLQSIIKEKISITDFSYSVLERDRQRLDCRSKNFLGDGKYGHCTKEAFRLYLKQTCEEDKSTSFELTDCRGKSYTFGFGFDGKPNAATEDHCKKFKISDCTPKNKPLIEAALKDCRDLIVLGGEPPANGDVPFPPNGKITGKLNGDCYEPLVMVFENDGAKRIATVRNSAGDIVPNEEIKGTRTVDVCKILDLEYADCTLYNVQKKLDTMDAYTIDEVPAAANIDTSNTPSLGQIEDALTHLLNKDCLEDGFVCPEKPELNNSMPQLPKNEADKPATTVWQPYFNTVEASPFSWLTASSVFAQVPATGPWFISKPICQVVFDRPLCSIAELRAKVLAANKSNSDILDISVKPRNIPSSYSDSEDAKKCPNNAMPDTYDTCFRLGLAKYLLAVECKKCPEEPTTQAYFDHPNPKTPCDCGGKENYDEETFECVSDFFQLTPDQLRPKYLTGSNYDSRRSTGDARDITFWLQKFGGKITNYIAALAVLFIAFNGFLMVAAAGDQDQIGKAKTGIIWTLVGLVVLAFAYVLVKTVISLAY